MGLRPLIFNSHIPALKTLNDVNVSFFICKYRIAFVFLPKELSLTFMEYNVADKMEWMMIFIYEFSRHFNITQKEAFNYLSLFKGIDYLDRNYGYAHTQSFASMVQDMSEFCLKNGGNLQ